jgi:hypothetical protein
MPFNLDPDEGWYYMVQFLKENEIDIDLRYFNFDLTNGDYYDNQTAYIIVSNIDYLEIAEAINSYGDFACFDGIPQYEFDEDNYIIGFYNMI